MLWTLRTRRKSYSNCIETLLAPPTLSLRDLLKDSTCVEGQLPLDHPDDLDDESEMLDSLPKLPKHQKRTAIAEMEPHNDLDGLPTCGILNTTPLPTNPSATPHRMSHRNFKRSQRCKMSKPAMSSVSTISVAKVIVGSLAHATASCALESDLELPLLSVWHGAYAAKPQKHYGAKKKYTIDELLNKHGFCYIAWDGKTPRPIVDSNGVIFAALAGRPDDPTYVEACNSMYESMKKELTAAGIKHKAKKDYRCGLFAACSYGLSYGKGQPMPLMLNVGDVCVSAEDCNICEQCIFALEPMPFPILQGLAQPPPCTPWNNSTFPCATFNFGGNVWTYKHKDTMNCLFGWCTIVALGCFNPSLGAHLILWELKMVIEFLHATTVFIPSVTITHSNTVPAPGDERVSFTQFCTGGLLHWVDYGFHMEKELYEQDYEAYQQIQAGKDMRWEQGLVLYSTVEELLLCMVLLD
ncbi:hypothetical protein IW261DRAFT_1570946 [Armillaria novae-zelandiae]|uniref:Uncharacterized protein n=1 Tax=Armillaria novae-zelandiae TaxID=153914 RepID=A0AA39NUY3_9AGAR|nr:hypothetical protein IW261DRAFT_1570946 [Armillaria novae-zelandiae]